jgi:hypothetical protein
MSGMDGFQTIRISRENAPKVAIIAISGYAFREVSWPVPDFLKMACSLRATYCLRKPLKAWEIIKAVGASGEVEAAGKVPRAEVTAGFGPETLAIDRSDSRRRPEAITSPIHRRPRRRRTSRRRCCPTSSSRGSSRSPSRWFRAGSKPKRSARTGSC